jgi:hypothetical protein
MLDYAFLYFLVSRVYYIFLCHGYILGGLEPKWHDLIGGGGHTTGAGIQS